MSSQLGQALRSLRKEAGYTLEQVAKAADITPAALSLFENGKRNPSPKVLGLIAAALDYPVEPLQELADEERSAGRLDEARYWYDRQPSSGRSLSPRPESPPRYVPSSSDARPSTPAYTRRPIEDLFPDTVVGSARARAMLDDGGSAFATLPATSPTLETLPESPTAAALSADASESTRRLRNLATQPTETPLRIEAVEQLGDQASLALRTLRGLVDDEDEEVAHKARRVLRELGIDVPSAEKPEDESAG